MSSFPKCWRDHPDCFAHVNGKCLLLSNEFSDAIGRVYIPSPTKYRDRECPFCKTKEDAGGTYDELCEKYPLNPGKGERK